MVAFILPANSATGDYEINNSYRIDSGSAVGLSRFGNNSRNGDTFTISFWVKRARLATNQILVCCKAGDSGSNAFVFQFTAADKIQVIGQPQAGTTGAGSNRTVILTTPVYRDTAAWYHIVYRQDTTQGTAGNRHRLYVNGVQQTTDTNDALDQNTEFLFFYNAGSFPYAIGNDERDNLFADWYMAEHHYTDGVSNGPDAFGKTNDNGVWIPKQYGGSHGTYGHYLKFEQSGAGSGTTVVGEHDYTTGTASTIGADSSGNDNHFHVQGYSVQDNTTDTPTNNFCTLNPLSAGSDMRDNGSFKEGNCELVNGGTGGESNGQKCSGTIGFANGKWYWEVKLISNTMTAGIVDSSISTTSDINLGSKNFVSFDSETGAINNIDGAVQGETVSSQYDDGDIIGIAVDADNQAAYFAINNTYQNSGNPTSGASKTGGATFTAGNQMLPLAADNSSASAGNHQYNFGNAPFSISSGNADANGHGNFEFAPPSGYFAICTKNLAEFG